MLAVDKVKTEIQTLFSGEAALHTQSPPLFGKKKGFSLLYHPFFMQKERLVLDTKSKGWLRDEIHNADLYLSTLFKHQGASKFWRTTVVIP